METIKDILGQELTVGDRVAMAQKTEGSRWQSVGFITEIATLRKDGKPRKQPLVKIEIEKTSRDYFNSNTTVEPESCLVKITHCEKCGLPWKNAIFSKRGHLCR